MNLQTVIYDAIHEHFATGIAFVEIRGNQLLIDWVNDTTSVVTIE